MTDHPITPPPELVRQWVAKNYVDLPIEHVEVHLDDIKICTEAARWGADQELEACCEWLRHDLDACELVGLRAVYLDHNLRADRRPKPPSLAEQATAQLDDAVIRGDCITTTDAMPILRAALKRLKELEGSND